MDTYRIEFHYLDPLPAYKARTVATTASGDDNCIREQIQKILARKEFDGNRLSRIVVTHINSATSERFDIKD
jgi:hypothetical protein